MSAELAAALADGSAEEREATYAAIKAAVRAASAAGTGSRWWR